MTGALGGALSCLCLCLCFSNLISRKEQGCVGVLVNAMQELCDRLLEGFVSGCVFVSVSISSSS